MARMIVPRYWAEARLQERSKSGQITVRRWGWSDDAPEKAQALAESRAREAMDRLRKGETLLRREPKVPYNGAEGVPIREEIVQRHGETLVTRNGYGALCLNTPDVCFVDVDFHMPPQPCGLIALAALGGAATAALVFPGLRLKAALFAALFTLILLPWALALIRRLRVKLTGGWEPFALARVRRVLGEHSEGRYRVYRTPAGLRVLATHRTFDPTAPETAAFFRRLGTDPIYARMCLRQHCFRARVSPKPWRAGVAAHLKPNPGVWPVSEDRLPDRKEWVARYEAAAKGYASCRLLEAIGTAPEHPAAREVRELHDELSRALTSLPLA